MNPADSTTTHTSLAATAVEPPQLLNIFALPNADATLAWPADFSMWLDRNNRVIFLPPEWDHFVARESHSGLERENILGRPVGGFIADENVRSCFHMLFERVRQEGRVARIVARCDSTVDLRAVQIRFTPSFAGALECRWSCIGGESAGLIKKVDHRIPAAGEYVRMCAWCRRVRMDMGWQPLETVAPELGLLDHEPMAPITHGICPKCSAALSAENTADHGRVAV